jgi:HTH-type transcriptional regulator / antitoxin HigA
MNIHPLHTADDYQAALKLVSAYFDDEPAAGSEASDHFEILITLIEAYEAKHYPMALPDPIEAIKFRMEQQGLSVADMEPYLGKPNRVYEILNRKRKLSLAMIRRLHSGLNISAEVLIAQ